MWECNLSFGDQISNRSHNALQTNSVVAVQAPSADDRKDLHAIFNRPRAGGSRHLSTADSPSSPTARRGNDDGGRGGEGHMMLDRVSCEPSSVLSLFLPPLPPSPWSRRPLTDMVETYKGRKWRGGTGRAQCGCCAAAPRLLLGRAEQEALRSRTELVVKKQACRATLVFGVMCVGEHVPVAGGGAPTFSARAVCGRWPGRPVRHTYQSALLRCRSGTPCYVLRRCFLGGTEL